MAILRERKVWRRPKTARPSFKQGGGAETMMRVIVEIHPLGVAEAKREIARLDIADISELAEYSSYHKKKTAPPDREVQRGDRQP
jgi:hypothetical protein